MKRTDSFYKKALRQMVKSSPNSLRAAVANEALEYGGSIESFFTDLLMHGCQSGMIGSLIYYNYTHAFYDKHYNEMEALRYEREEAYGVPLRAKGDVKNWYAWMA